MCALNFLFSFHSHFLFFNSGIYPGLHKSLPIFAPWLKVYPFYDIIAFYFVAFLFSSLSFGIYHLSAAQHQRAPFCCCLIPSFVVFFPKRTILINLDTLPFWTFNFRSMPFSKYWWREMKCRLQIPKRWSINYFQLYLIVCELFTIKCRYPTERQQAFSKGTIVIYHNIVAIAIKTKAIRCIDRFSLSSIPALERIINALELQFE